MGQKEGLKGLDKFAKLFIRKIKDGQLAWLELALENRESDYEISQAYPLIQRLKQLDDGTKNLIRATVNSSVMAGMHDFLHALQRIHDDGENDIVIWADGENIAGLSEDGLNYDVFYWDEDYSDYVDSRKANELVVGKKSVTE